MLRNTQQREFRLQHDAERSFRPAEQIDPVHTWTKRITGCVLPCVRQRDLRDGKVYLVSAPEFTHFAIHKCNAESPDMLSRTAVPKASRAAGVGCDRAANRGGDLCRIRSVELLRACG